jgi:hypothetical protein
VPRSRIANSSPGPLRCQSNPSVTRCAAIPFGWVPAGGTDHRGELGVDQRLMDRRGRPSGPLIPLGRLDRAEYLKLGSTVHGHPCIVSFCEFRGPGLTYRCGGPTAPTTTRRTTPGSTQTPRAHRTSFGRIIENRCRCRGFVRTSVGRMNCGAWGFNNCQSPISPGAGTSGRRKAAQELGQIRVIASTLCLEGNPDANTEMGSLLSACFEINRNCSSCYAMLWARILIGGQWL